LPPSAAPRGWYWKTRRTTGERRVTVFSEEMNRVIFYSWQSDLPNSTLLARFRIGRPDKPIGASQVFGEIPAVWVDEFRRHGYTNDPKLGALVGIFVDECEPLNGQLTYRNQNSLSRLESDGRHQASAPVVPARPVAATERPVAPPPIVRAVQELPSTLIARDGVHVGIDIGGRREKGFDLCITEWVGGVLNAVRWKRLPHATPLPPTSFLRALLRHGDLAGLAEATQASASATAAALWQEIQRLGAVGIHIDSPSAFSRNRLGHGRLCEKRSLTGVSFQSTPSIACGNEHGGDRGWLVYGMIAFAACLHRGQLTNADWMEALQSGTFARCDSAGIVIRECFPTATISVLRAQRRETDVERALGRLASLPEVQAVLRYLKHGVKGVKRPGDALYDRADALVAALGALPHVAPGFREVMNWGAEGSRWSGAAGDEQLEGSFWCVA